jgi:hypothetical protein
MYVTRESEKETKKTQLLALLVANSVDFGSTQSANAWESKIKNLWNRYLALEYGIELAPEKEKELNMLEYYQGVVQKLKPTLYNDKGSLVVTGFDSLLGIENNKQKKG